MSVSEWSVLWQGERRYAAGCVSGGLTDGLNEKVAVDTHHQKGMVLLCPIV